MPASGAELQSAHHRGKAARLVKKGGLAANWNTGYGNVTQATVAS